MIRPSAAAPRAGRTHDGRDTGGDLGQLAGSLAPGTPAARSACLRQGPRARAPRHPGARL